LRRTEKLAATGRLAASIAHEINNPLEAVMNILFLLSSNKSLDDTARSYLDLAQQEVARVSNIAIQTLRFYRQTSGPTKTNLHEVMDSVLISYQSRLTAQNIEVERRYEAHRELECLAGEIRQVFANLVSNAIDAMAQNGRLCVRIADSMDWNGTGLPGVRITVADSGTGIPPQVLPHIFEAFVTTKETTGTGLGLWVSLEIIQKHKGSIRVRSSLRPGKSGTVFSLFLPCAEDTRISSSAGEGVA
jgi:signal transduction histidine kinase